MGPAEKNVIVRFAPSPTGPFSLGNARTALFNWLFCRHKGGKFLLRIEDTDTERSKKEFETDIIESLTWLGITWDESIERESERLDVYEGYIKKLIEAGRAYYCFCTKEELEREREVQLSQGLPPRYSGKCRSIPIQEAAARSERERAVIRFVMPEREVAFHDIVHGKIVFKGSLIGDMVIAKSIREPLYNFAVVVDDFEMKITHVIRGEDHLPNTPKQLFLQEALGFPRPLYAHLPLLLAPDRRKLSKRYLDTSLAEYRKRGYLREAMVNFLVLLGWHPEKDREVLTTEEMTREFSLNRVQKAGAVFNEEKLNWLNAHYIRYMEPDALLKELVPFMREDWLSNPELVKKALAVSKDRLKRLDQFVEFARFFFELPAYPKELLLKGAPGADTTFYLQSAAELIATLSPEEFSREKITLLLMSFADKEGRGAVLWPLRVALSGQAASPGPFETLEVLGKEESLRRIRIAIEKLSAA